MFPKQVVFCSGWMLKFDVWITQHDEEHTLQKYILAVCSSDKLVLYCLCEYEAVRDFSQIIFYGI